MAASVIAILTTSGAAGFVASPSADSRAQGSDEVRVSAPVKCSAREAVRFYQRRWNEHRMKMGAAVGLVGTAKVGSPRSRCPRYLAHLWQRKARAWRLRAERWVAYHYDWQTWLPDKWARIGACETGYGRRPGQWTWNSGTYQGAFGFYYGSWDAFAPRAARKAGPYPSEAYLATPRQQYEVALAIYRAYGFSGWGCRGA